MAQPVINEHHYHRDTAIHDDTGSSSVSMVVLLIAVLFIVAFALFALRVIPMPGWAGGTTRSVDVNLPAVDVNMPDATPGTAQ